MSKPFELTVAEATNNTKYHLSNGAVVRHGVWTLATEKQVDHPYIKAHIDAGVLLVRNVVVSGEAVEVVTTPVAPTEPVVEAPVVVEAVIETSVIVEPVPEVAPEPIVEVAPIIEAPVAAPTKSGKGK